MVGVDIFEIQKIIDLPSKNIKHFTFTKLVSVRIQAQYTDGVSRPQACVMPVLRLDFLDDRVPSRWYLPSIFSIEIRVFFNFNSFTHHSCNISVFSGQNLRLVEADVVVRVLGMCTKYLKYKNI